MHLFFLSRGIKHEVERAMGFLEHVWFKYPFYENGKEEVLSVQAHLQPVQLWSYVFPEGAQEEVLRGMKFDFVMQKQMGILRRALGAEKIPKFNPEGLAIPAPKKNVQFIPIGIKKDNHTEKGTEQL